MDADRPVLATPRPDTVAAGVRLFLLEFLDEDRFRQFRAEIFPFIRGYAESQGVAVRWGCFGIGPENHSGNRFIIELGHEDEQALCRALDEHGATHLVCHERLGDRLRRALASHCPDMQIATMDRGRSSWHLVAPLRAQLGLAPHVAAADVSSFLVDVAEPDYTSEALNERARQNKPLVKVICGPTCVYAHPLRHNRHYLDLQLPASVSDRGCTFCGPQSRQKYSFATPPVALAVRQIRAAARTCPPERHSGDYLLDGVLPFFKLRTFVDALLLESVPPARFLFGCRIDELLRMAPVVEEVLPRLAAAGHALCIQNMGVENFSQAENERLNKQISVAQVEAAVTLIRRWERDWPGAFAFWKYGGFGYITFTPWTTLADLEENLAALRRLGFACTSLFATSRLMLIADRPITLLAERDGLVVPRFADDAAADVADGGCLVSWAQSELPWRFAHPEVALIYSILVRLFPASASPTPNDALATELQAAAAGWPPGWQDTELFAALVSAARARPDVETASELMALAGPGVAPSAHRSAPTPARGLLPLSRVASVLAELSGDCRESLGGFALTDIQQRAIEPEWGEVCVILSRGAERLCVLLRPAEGFPHSYLRTTHLSVSYRQDMPADTPDKAAAVRALAQWVERHAFASDRCQSAQTTDGGVPGR